MIRKDTDNLIKIIKKNGSDWLEGGNGIPVMTGNRAGVVDAGNGKIWVRFSNGQEEKVLNSGAPLAFDWHITIGHWRSQPTIWRVRDVRQVYNETPPSFIQAHAFQHYLGGFDELDIDRKQILSATALVSDQVNFLVRVYGGLFPIPGGWVLGQSTDGNTKPDIDLSPYIPTAGAQYINIEHDETGAIVINDSAPVKESKELLDTTTDIALVPAGHRMVGFVMLYEGQPTLLNKHISPPGLFMTDYAVVETGYQIDHATLGSPLNNDKFPFYKVGDGTLRYILYEDLLAAVIASATPTTRWEPLTNGDPSDPQIIFDGYSDVVMIEVPI